MNSMFFILVGLGALIMIQGIFLFVLCRKTIRRSPSMNVYAFVIFLIGIALTAYPFLFVKR